MPFYTGKVSEILKTTEELKLIGIDELIPYANIMLELIYLKTKLISLSSLREFGL